MQKTGLAQWRLKSGADRRFRSGHPWVYSNELTESPKGIEPGAAVELRDAGGKFLARGYGNPHSLIAFRAMSRDESVANPLAPEQILEALRSARSVREFSGYGDFSHRLSFGEADRLPGLIVDSYRLEKGRVLVVQAHTAGMDRVVQSILPILERLMGNEWPTTTVIIRNNAGSRKLEGLEEQETQIAKTVPGVDPRKARILVRPAIGGTEAVPFWVDLVQGQKTGFFLDQSANIELAASRVSLLKPASGRLKILDLCTYVGQWSTQLAQAYRKQGTEVQVLAVDASAQALELAKQNIEAQGAKCETLRGDVLKDLESLPLQGFDLVISDPPALIKGRKDIPAGTHAYLQLNTQVFRLVKKGGAVISCSCSSLLEEEEFLRALSKASARNGRFTRWVGRGSQSPDHPMLTEFPEGRYLKAWVGFVD